MRIQVAVPEEHVDPRVLNAALESVTRLDESLISAGSVPLFKQALPRVRWEPEPPGQEHFDHAKLVIGRGHGDCDDLAPWHAASLRATGVDPGARAVVKRSGPQTWHAIVQRSDGKIEDPSKAAGMPGPGSPVISGIDGRCHGVVGAIVRPMTLRQSVVGGTYLERPSLALRPVYDRAGQPEAWQARADLPWHWLPGKGRHDLAMVSLHHSPIASQAITGAIRGMMRLGTEQDRPNWHHLNMLRAVDDALQGASYHDLLEGYGREVADTARAVCGAYLQTVGFSFGSIAKKAFGTVKKVAHGISHNVGPVLRSKYIQMGAAAAGQAFGIPAPATMAAMNAAGKGMAMVDTATGKASKATPAQAASMLADKGQVTFVHPQTKKTTTINVPARTGVKLAPATAPSIPAAMPADASQSWQPGSRTPIHPSMMPTSFTMHCTPIP